MINPMDVTGRAFVVTGASSGIGRATAILLSRLGAKVVLVARNEDRLKETVGLMEGEGHRVTPFDLRDIEGVSEWMRATAKQVGPLSGLVHSAGIEATCPLRILASTALHEVMQVNFTAGVFLAKAFRQRGVSAANGSLVFLSSVAGLIGQAGHIAYCASKAAVGGFVRAAAVELAPEGIRVNCVAPGWVDETEISRTADRKYTQEQIQAIRSLHLLGTCRPEDVAYCIAFLLADTGRWITGTTLVIDGGYTAQ